MCIRDSVQAVRQTIRDDDYYTDYDDEVCPLDMKPVSFRGQELQVVTNVVDYELNPGQYYEGN